MKKLNYFLAFFLFLSISASAQINQALTATANHSGGGATIYGPQNYNDGIITATPSQTPWGWVSSNGWIEYTWTSPVNFNAVAFYKADRPMYTCNFEYWDGTQYVNFYSYSNTVTGYDSVSFPTISTTRLRFNPVSGSSNPNHREIRVWLNSFAPNDAAVSALDSPRVFCAGSQNIVVTVANYGTTQIDSVNIDWEFNGQPRTGFTYVGLLDTIGSTNPSSAQVVLGTENFPAGSNYTIKAWTSMPNGMADTSNTNDTLTATVGPALQGTFTVNPAAPASSTNFQTLGAMASAFNSNGVCGPVTVNVVPGVYNEMLEFGPITGTSSTNTITIDGGDSSQTRVYHNGSGNIATLTLDGTDWLTVKNMTIEATGTSGVAVLFTNDCDNNTISNNILRVSTSSTSSLATNVSFSGSKTSPTSTPGVGYNNNTIANNYMRGGYYGVRMYGPFSTMSCFDNKVMYNDIDSIYYYGVYVYYQDGAEVVGNSIVQTNRGNAFGDGIYMYTNNNGRIEGNYVLADDYGVYWSNSNTNAQTLYKANEFINNMIISNTDFANYIYSVDSMKYYHNSLESFGSGPSLYIAGSTAYPMADWDMRNNAISSAGGGYALDMATFTTAIFSIMDNNNYYTTGNTLIDINNTTYANLAAFQTASSPLNANSISGDPLYVSSTDLHATGSTMNDNGDNATGVLVDIDGQVRPSSLSTTVDIGADEFDVFPYDAGITSVVSPAGNICPGNVTPVVEIFNFGSATIDSIKVYWNINGTLDSTTHVGTISPGTSGNASLANVNISAGQLYNISFYTGTINNGQTDQDITNDSLILNGLRTGLTGTVTMNPALPASATNFTDFASLSTVINNYGVCGATVVNVAPGVHTGAVQFDDIPGASSVNTLTIDGGDSSTTAIVHNGSGNIATLTLNNTDWITVKNLTIEATGTSGVAVLFTGGNDHCTISNNVLRVNTSSTSSLATNVTFSGSTTSPTTTVSDPYTYNTIANNRMRGGYYGIRMYGTTSSIGCIGNTVVGNDMDSVYYYGVYVYYQDSAEVVNNSIIQANRGNVNGDGIYMYTNNNGRIVGNYVYADDYAMYWSNSNTLLRTLRRPNEVINNMIISNNDFASYLYSVDSVNFWHNSLQTHGTSPALYIAGSTAYPFNDWDLRNNILSASGAAALDMATYTDTIFNKMDNNCYYTTGSPLIDINNTTYANLPAYQTAQPLLNTSSLEGDPQYTSATDLHIIGAFVNDSGDASVGIAVDIDGEVRPAVGAASVDIGADEYDPPTCPPASLLSAFNPTLDSITLSWFSSNVGVTFEYVVVLSGSPMSSGTPMITGNDTVGVGSLTASTRYDFYVRVICGRGDTSQWMGPEPFGTANGVPYLQDFETWPTNLTGLIQEEGWYTLGTPTPHWEVGGSTSSSSTGPVADHTIGTGGTFTYLECSGGTTGDTDTLWSAPIYFAPNQNAVTLEYWYHMYGAAMGSLEVYALSNGVMTPVLSTFVGQQQPTQTSPWLSATANIGGFGGQSVQLMFVGIRGTSFTSDMAIDDVRLFIPSPTDGGVSDILSPTSGCGLGTDTVTVEITNFGTGSISNFPVQYTVNGGTPVIETYTGTIPSGGTANYSFNATVNLSTSGTYIIRAQTNISGDGDLTNDDDSTIVESIPLVGSPATTFYTEDFENGTGGWTAAGTPLWARGVPAGTVISTAGSGSNAWVTNLNGNYGVDNANAYLQSPCFDFTGALNPVIEFHAFWHSESTWDGSRLESSIDGGATWQPVGAVGDTINWYTGNVFALGGDGWEGTVLTSWVVSAHELFGLAGQSSVLLRFVFSSDASVNNYEGLGIDNVKIYNNINVGVQEQASNLSTFSLSPNPSNGQFILSLSTEQSEQMQMTIRDMEGKLVHNEQLNVNGNFNKSMDLSHLSKGVYFLRLQNDDESKIEKLIIQ